MKHRNLILLATTLFFIACGSESTKKSIEENVEESVEVEAISKELIDVDKTDLIFEDDLTDIEKEAKLVDPIKGEDSNNPINGTTYVILSSTKTTMRNCYDCMSTSNCSTKYVVEGRQYTKWENGKAVKVWTSTVNVFMGCGTW